MSRRTLETTALVYRLQTSNTALLKSYYMQAYSTVRKYSSCFVALCPPESQSDGSAFQSFMAAAPYTKVIQDVHRCGPDTRGCSPRSPHEAAYYTNCRPAARRDPDSAPGQPNRSASRDFRPHFGTKIYRPAAKPRRGDGRRYYSIDGNAPFSTWSQNAYVNVTAATKAYIKNGGLPLAIGEWTLAGAPQALQCRLDLPYRPLKS